ncbi:MAG: peptidoglycan DD-metalloendopeptidase family protein [Candidatus Aminicenantes bacterium]|nr:peptidoglycan DD-metalloendopeptidase family protein [Candidatus Aminicenantes bacterium]
MKKIWPPPASPVLTVRPRRRLRRPKRTPLVLTSLLVAAVAAILYFGSRRSGPPGTGVTTPPVDAALAPAPSLVVRRESVARGATLASLLKKHGFTDLEIHTLKESVKPVYDLGRILVGHELRLAFEPDGPWRSLEYDIDADRYLRVVNADGAPTAEVKAFPIEVETALVWGRIQETLIASVDEAGEEDWLALRLAEIFGWDIDFNTDLRPGDTFKVLFEKKSLEGRFRGYGDIVAAEFINEGRAYRAFRYTYPDTKATDFFDERGNSLRREFLRSPLKFGYRVTSRFSSSRLHPIRKVYRAHYGVDYGAPLGYPVQATADGEVREAGANGAAGRTVRIRHANAYETLYLHLSRIYVRPGQKVKGGDVIGTVGSSGESTGPHLDYRIRYHARYINPLGWTFKPVEPLRKEFLADYQTVVESGRFLLEAPLVFASGCVPTGLF